MAADLRIGTRASALALWQANWVKAELEQRHRGIVVELVTIRTQGDRLFDAPLAEVGGKGIFVSEIELALARGEVDLAVHSLKDMPTVQPDGLVIAAVPTREDPRDALVSRLGLRLADLPAGARVGTSSQRRAAQLLAYRPDLRIAGLRGNLDTRLRRAATEYDAVVLALAGLRRLKAEHHIAEVIPTEVCLPAVGQGALAVEARADDARVCGLVEPLDDPEARATTTAERSLLRHLGGGCVVPIGGLAVREGDELVLSGVVAHPSGHPCLRDTLRGRLDGAEALGKAVAARLLAAGADALLRPV